MQFPVVPFGGRHVRSLKTKLFEYIESVYSPGLQLPTHVHGQAFVDFTIWGYGESEAGGCHRHAEPGTITLHPAVERHDNHFSAVGARVLIISIEVGLLPAAVADLFKSGRFASHPEAKVGGMAREIYCEFRSPGNASALSLDGLTLQLLGALLRRDSARPVPRIPTWLQHANQVIDERFPDPLPLASLADVVGVHPVHLAREFKRYFHRTIGSRIRQLRIEQACRDLSSSSAPIAEIALDAGFSDQSSFTEAFRREMGVTPLEFRRLSQVR